MCENATLNDYMQPTCESKRCRYKYKIVLKRKKKEEEKKRRKKGGMVKPDFCSITAAKSDDAVSK